MDPAEERARNSMPPGVFDTLPEPAKFAMIAAQRSLIEAEQERIAQEQALIAQEIALEEQREALIESERRRERLENEEAARIAYKERQERGLAISREQLRASGMVERIGQSKPVEKRKTVRAEQGCIQLSSEFATNEPRPESLLQGANLLGFRRETIRELIPQMQQIRDNARAHRDVTRGSTGYMMFHIWTGATRRAGTRAIALSDDDLEGDIDELYEALEVLLNDIEKVKAGYSYIYEGTERSFVHFFFRASYYPRPRDVSNWGKDIEEIEERDCFNIFTAANKNIPCAIQVAKRLWGPDAEETTIEQIIERASPKVCIVKPYTGIKKFSEIKDFSDLVIELNSPYKKINTVDTDIIYLLHYNEHVGILEDLRNQKPKQTETTFRPVFKRANCKKVTMCFDIECYFDVDNNQNHIPYVCCACFVYDVEENGVVESKIGNIMEFEGKDCVAQMLDYAADNVDEFGLGDIELIAHNGGGYDFHYILTSVADPSIIKNPLIRNNNFITFKFEHCDIKFTVKDSYNFLACSLQKAAETFLGEKDRKTDFPHHETRSEEDLQKVYAEWISVKKEWSVNVEKEKMVVQANHVINQAENPSFKKLIDWSKEYCVNDVIVLAKVWIKFKKLIEEVFECDIVDQTHTLAGMSFRLFEAHLPVYLDTHKGHGKIRLHHPLKVDFDNMRAALVGGRCISVNGIYENIACLDVKSLYPAAMTFYDQPYGHYRKVNAEIPSELGIYYCHVEPVPINGHGFFPLRHEGNVTYAQNLEAYDAWYTSVDMDIGRREGHKITAIPFEPSGFAPPNSKDLRGGPVGYSWKHKGKIFAQYIQGVLYKLKLKYEQMGAKQHRAIIKLVMNSLWGKFAQKWMDDKYVIKSEEECDFEKEICHKIWDTDWFLVKNKQKKNWASKPVQNGVFTLSWARFHMFVIWNKVVIPGTVCVYSDTDSIMVLVENIIKDATFELNGVNMKVIGDEMGQLELENVFHELLCVGKKQYMGSYGDLTELEYKKRFKGIPQEYIRPEMYAHLLESKDHTVQVHFLKFKREWGCVQGYIERKTVRQT